MQYAMIRATCVNTDAPTKGAALQAFHTEWGDARACRPCRQDQRRAPMQSAWFPVDHPRDARQECWWRRTQAPWMPVLRSGQSAPDRPVRNPRSDQDVESVPVHQAAHPALQRTGNQVLIRCEYRDRPYPPQVQYAHAPPVPRTTP